MAILTQIFEEESSSGVGDIVDIVTSAGVVDGNPFYGATILLFGFTDGTVLSGSDICFFPTVNTPVSLPPTADPPFPPVWPFPFSTDVIYGRDHLSTNLKMIRGDTYIFEIAVILNGAVVDLTGCTLTMTVKWDISDSDASAVFVLSTATSGIVLTDAAAGLATLTVAHALTTSLPSHVCNLVYDIQMINGSSQYSTVLNGILSVYPDATTV